MSLQTSFRNTLHKAEKFRQVSREPIYRRALMRGVAATTEHGSVVFPHEYGTVVDVGANRGQFAVFSLCRFPRAQLFCFEPGPAAYQKLTEVLSGSRRVHTEQCAIGATRGSLTLNVTRHDDSSSVLKPTALQLQTFPKTDSVASIEVEVKMLDEALQPELLEPPYLLKIDVQGFELEVLKGAQRLLAEGGDLLIESSFAELYAGQALADEIIAALWSQGYRLRGIFSLAKGPDGAPVQGDFLFSPRA